MERLIQTIRDNDHARLNKNFNLQQAVHAAIQKLRNTVQKTINITPFEAHFGRKCNTPASNIGPSITSALTKTKNRYFYYNKKIKYYLDEDRNPGP